MHRETTQAELDALRNKQLVNWCFGFAVADAILFLIDWLSPIKAGIALAVITITYFVIKKIWSNRETAEQLRVTERKPRSHAKILRWFLLFLGILNGIIFAAFYFGAKLVNLQYRDPLFVLCYETLFLIAWAVINFVWIKNSFKPKIETGFIGQIKVFGRLLDSGDGIEPAWYGMPAVLPDGEVVPVSQKLIQISHKEVKEAVGSKDKEEGPVIEAHGTEPMVFVGSCSFRAYRTKPYLLATNAEKMLPLMIFEVLQFLLNEAVLDKEDPVGSIQKLRESLIERSKGLLDSAAESIGFDCESCTMSLQKPSYVMERVIEGQGELVKVWNYDIAVKRLKGTIGLAAAKAMAAAIMGDVSAEQTTISVDENGAPGKSGKGKKGSGGRARSLAERMMGAVAFGEGVESEREEHDNSGDDRS